MSTPRDPRPMYDALLRAIETLDVEQGIALLAHHDARALLRTPPDDEAPLLPELCAQDDRSDVPAAVAASRRHAWLGLMLDAGADPSVPDADGMTPLAWTAVHNRWTEAQRLIQAGANPYRADAAGDTLLDNLLQDEHGPAALRTLMGQGFAPETLIHNGTFDALRLFHDPRWSDHDVLHLWQHLMANGCVFEPHGSWRWTVCQGWSGCADQALALGADPSGTWTPWNMDLPVTSNGERPGPWNALHQAAYEGHAHLLPRLLGLGLKVEQPDAWGITPLHAALLNPRPTGTSADTVRALLGAGASLHAPAPGLDGATPLDLASTHPTAQSVVRAVREARQLALDPGTAPNETGAPVLRRPRR